MTTTVTTDRDQRNGYTSLASLIVYAVAAAWLAGVLWMTIPRGGVCWSVLPAPAGCDIESRLPVAVVASVLVLGLAAITAVAYYAVLYAQ